MWSQDAVCRCWDCELLGDHGGAQGGIRYKEVESTGNIDSRGQEQDVLKDEIARPIKRAAVTKEQDFLSNRSHEGVGIWQLHLNP